MPIVVHEQRNETEHPSRFSKWFDRRLGGLASAIICVSESTRIYNIREKGIDPERIFVIPNGLKQPNLSVYPLQWHMA